jgi:transposase
LVSNYDLVVLPEFMTHSMIRKRRYNLGLPKLLSDVDAVNSDSRVAPQSSGQSYQNHTPEQEGVYLSKKTCKNLLSFSHYAFRQRLLARAKADPNRKKDVLITTEEFTSKQCSSCGYIHQDLGGNEHYHCVRCGLDVRRDTQGAFNILLRSIIKSEICAT